MSRTQAAEPAQQDAWPVRAAGLAVLGAAIGLAIQQLLDRHHNDFDPSAYAAATFLFIGGLVFGLTLERTRIVSSGLFSLLCAFVVASVVYWNLEPDQRGLDEPWRLACAVLAAGIAVPLFQAWRAKGGGSLRALDYRTVHGAAWTIALTGLATLLFTLIAWLLAFLLASLFDLIGLTFLKDLIDDGWFAAMLTGGAAGGAIGLLRDKESLLHVLQRIVMTVLSVLAPVLGAGLLLFLVSLPFTGLEPLWRATKSTTPIMLLAIIFAFTLANSAIGNGPEEETKSRLVRWGAMALGAAMLPLGAIAAISTGKRIGQYGLSPDRLWAVVFVTIACAAGLTYMAALVRRRQGWALGVRPANLAVGFGICGIALVLCTPLVSFGALSAHSQLGRLQSGKVSPEKFDWAAMRFDFGEPGRDALARLAKNASPQIARLASDALSHDSRYEMLTGTIAEQVATAKIRVLPLGSTLPDDLRTALVEQFDCRDDAACVVLLKPAENRALVLGQRCADCYPDSAAFEIAAGKWVRAYATATADDAWQDRKKLHEALETGSLELRAVTRHQLFLDGKPVGSLVD